MKIGLFGPAEWLGRIDEFTEHVDVQWGTDDGRRVNQLVGDPPSVDGVLVHGSADFVTSDISGLTARRGIVVYALADDSASTAWIDLVDGVKRISSVTQLLIPRPDQGVAPVTGVPAPATAGRVIAVWGPVGSPGISTVAISLAVLAARAGRSVLLCDVDTRGASLSIALGLIDDVPGFAAACRLAGRKELSDDHIWRLAVPVPAVRGRVSVLTGLPRASRWVEVAPPKSREVLDCARGLFDLVVVDVGSGIEENEWVDGAPQRDGAARSIIMDADCVVAVGSPDAVGIARFIRGLDELSGLCESPLAVLNQTTRSTAREASDAIARFSRHRVAATIARDSRGGLEDAASRASGSAASVWDVVHAAVDALGPDAKR